MNCAGVRLGRRVLLAITACALAVGCADRSPTGSTGPATTTIPSAGAVAPGQTASETTRDLSEVDPCATDPGASGCEFMWENKQASNNRFADRLPYDGDRAAAEAARAEVTARLTPLAGTGAEPTEQALLDALAGLGDPQVSANAIGAQGLAFGLWFGEGCVFGSIFEGELEVEISGPIHDGGCLAVQP